MAAKKNNNHIVLKIFGIIAAAVGALFAFKKFVPKAKKSSK